jgi:hypothetical protein
MAPRAEEMERSAMIPNDKDPYAFYFRWGGFRVSLTSKVAIVTSLGVIAALFGLKLSWPLWH